MKLAEALILRADYQKRIEQVKKRIILSVKIQEGEKPPEDAENLITELNTLYEQLTELVQKINKTNSLTVFQGGKSLTDVLAERDKYALKRDALTSIVEAASIRQDRYTKSEVKYIRMVDVAEIQRRIDHLAKEYRTLDTQIQEANWKTEVL